MFIRKKLNKSASTSIQIIQKIKGNNKRIKTIGSSSNPTEIEILYQKALYEMPRLYKATLFDPPSNTVISELNNDSISVLGKSYCNFSINDAIKNH